MLRFPRPGPPEWRSPASSVLSEHYDFLHRIRSRLSIRFSRRSSQIPGESIPYLCPALGSRPVHRSSPFAARRRGSPHFADGEDTSTADFSRLNHAASVPAAYASSDASPHPHARLASGRWLTFAGWELNPLDSIEKFPSSTSDFLLSQIYPGATAKLPQSPGAPF